MGYDLLKLAERLIYVYVLAYPQIFDLLNVVMDNYTINPWGLRNNQREPQKILS